MAETEYGYAYDNFEDFKADHPDEAKELLANVKPGTWQDSDIYYYDDPASYADYNVREGWYGCLINKDLATMDYHGAPSLYDFIDFDKLGQALIDNGDPSTTFETGNGNVIETNYGW